MKWDWDRRTRTTVRCICIKNNQRTVKLSSRTPNHLFIWGHLWQWIPFRLKLVSLYNLINSPSTNQGFSPIVNSSKSKKRMCGRTRHFPSIMQTAQVLLIQMNVTQWRPSLQFGGAVFTNKMARTFRITKDRCLKIRQVFESPIVEDWAIFFIPLMKRKRSPWLRVKTTSA